MPPKSSDKAIETKAPDDSKQSAARQRELDSAIATITKAYGEGSIMRLGDARALVKIDVIPTGALAVDLALGVGGVPRGRVVEIFGPESSGKTTLFFTSSPTRRRPAALRRSLTPSTRSTRPTRKNSA